MPRLTPEQIKGSQFEIWVEQLFKNLGVKNVRRNVVYHRARYCYRQVDVEFYHQGLVIVELKYSSNGNISINLREGEKKKSGQLLSTIDNLLDELEERRRFVQAGRALLVTNKDFNNEVYHETKNYSKINIYTGEDLTRLSSKLSNKDIDFQIQHINLRYYSIKPTREYLTQNIQPYLL